MNTVSNIKHDNTTVRTDFDTAAAADTFTGKKFFPDSSGRTQPVRGNRTCQHGSSDFLRRKSQAGKPGGKELQKGPALHSSFARVFLNPNGLANRSPCASR